MNLTRAAKTLRPLRVRRAVPLLALAALLAAPGPLARGASSDDGEIRRVGTLPRFPADAVAALGERVTAPNDFDQRAFYGGTLLSVPKANQLWQIFPTVEDATTSVAVRNLKTLKIVKTLQLPVTLVRGARSDTGGDWAHAFDGDDRLFLIGSRHNTDVIWTVIEVDLHSFATRLFHIAPPFSTAGFSNPAFAPGAMEYDPYSDAILMLFGGVPGTSVAGVTTLAHRVDLRTGAQATRQVRSCNGPLASVDEGTRSQFGGIVTERFVYFSCQRLGSIGAVVKIQRDKLLDPTSDEEAVAGPGYLDTALADPEGGRIFLVTRSGEVWAYDITTSSFVGVIATGTEGEFAPKSGFGLDAESGRLFFLSNHLGLGIAEGRFYPIPQARTFPAFKAPGQERIISDAKTGRIFVLTGASANRAREWVVYDVGRAPEPPPPPDPDRNTADVAEQAGVTDARYFASGTGYGVRTILAKGVSAVPPQPTAGVQAPLAGIIARNINSKCGFTDRELVVGRVAKAEYDTGSAAAQAVGFDVDERSKLDLANPSRCDVTATSNGSGYQGIFSTEPFASSLREHERGVSWDRRAAFCSSSEGGERETARSANEGASSASVECPLPGGKLVATATGYLTGAVAVGRSSVATEIVRDGKGVLSTVVSEAQDIEIAGVISIGRIRAVATSRSNGRPPKGEMSTHAIRLEGVKVGDNVVCEENCRTSEVLRVLNLAGAGRVEFRSASGRDDALLKGSKRGASTAVQKSVARQASDQALVGDRTTEVAALEMIVYNDNTEFGRARQIFQFAGVASAATYNVALLPTGTGFGDDLGGGGGVEDLFNPGGSELDAILPDVDVLPPSVPSGAVTGEDADAGGGPLARAVRALARGIRMFFTQPRHALLLFTAWALFSLPPVLSRRRRLLAMARSD